MRVNREVLFNSGTTIPETSEEYVPVQGSPPNNGKRRRIADPSNWKKHNRKRLREAGEEYLNTKNALVPMKKIKPVDCSKCSKKCSSFISEDDRQDIHKAFWKLNDMMKRQYIINSVAQKQKERKTTESEQSRRAMTNLYSIQLGKNKIPTHNVSNTFVRNALKCKLTGNLACESMRGRSKKNLFKDLDDDIVKGHINTYERVPSHYCRARSQRQYLTGGLSIQKMYDEYIHYCEANGFIPVHIWKYREAFKSLNIAFHKPRADECDTCFKYRHSTEVEKEGLSDDHEAHLKRKRDAIAFKQTNKEAAEQGRQLFIEFDLEAVLYCPAVKANCIFFKRQLAVYNLTIYDATTRRADCYCWNESEAARGSSEIASCMFNFLKKNQNGQKIVLMSDSCTGQNRNTNVSAMFMYAVQTLNIPVIEHGFFEPGHSFMECDSVHGHISKTARDKELFVPDDWYNTIRSAGSNYHVIEMDNFIEIAAIKEH